MDSEIIKRISALEQKLGFKINRSTISIEDKESYNEIYSYSLALKYYEKNDDVLNLIKLSLNILSMLLKNYPFEKNLIANFYSIIGNLYYVIDEFSTSSGYFMRGLSYSKNDINLWYEFIFSLRSLGEIELFEKIMFNFKKIYSFWEKDFDFDFNQEKVQELVNRLNSDFHSVKRHHVQGKIEIIKACNQKCPFCSVKMTQERIPLMEIKTKMLELKKNGATEIMFSGGEPTLRKELPVLITYANMLRYNEICIQTNGSKLHDKIYLQTLSDAGPIQIKFDISFHCFEKNTYYKLGGKKASYEKFIEGLHNLNKFNIPFYTTTVINSLNYKLLKEHVKFCEKNFPNLRHFSFNFVDPTVHAAQNKWVVPKYSEAKRYMHDAFGYILEKGMTFRIEFVPLCFLQGFEEFASELRRKKFDEPSYFFIKNTTNSLQKRSNTYLKAPQCQECVLETKCHGLNNKYAEIYGFDELTPVKEKNTSKHPKHAIIQISNKCNHNCVFCSVDRSNIIHLTLKEIKQKILFFTSKGVDQLTLSGGEPSLRNDLIEILRYAKEKGIKRIVLQTNGIVLSNKKYLEKLISIFPIDFLISFHASDEEIYKKITGMKKDFHLALRALNSINELNYGNHGIGIVICSLNYKHLKDHIKFLQSNFPKINFYNFIFIDPVGDAKKNLWSVTRMNKVEPYIYDTLNYIRSNNLNAVVDRLPLCYLKGFEEYSANTRDIIRTSSNLYYLINDNSIESSASRFYHPKICDTCRLKKICGGLPPTYIDVFGSDELKPVSADIKKIIQKIKCN